MLDVVATAPVPTTRFLTTRVVGAGDLPGLTTGSAERFVALATAGTPDDVDAGEVAAAFEAVVLDDALLPQAEATSATAPSIRSASEPRRRVRAERTAGIVRDEGS